MGMSTKAYLGQIERLDIMIQHKIDDLDKLKKSIQPTTMKIKEVNVQENKQDDKVADIATKIYGKEQEINDLIDRRYGIIGKIEKINDARLYDILAQRYIDCKQIADISVRGISSLASKKRILKDALNEFEKEYGKEYL